MTHLGHIAPYMHFTLEAPNMHRKLHKLKVEIVTYQIPTEIGRAASPRRARLRRGAPHRVGRRRRRPRDAAAVERGALPRAQGLGRHRRARVRGHHGLLPDRRLRRAAARRRLRLRRSPARPRDRLRQSRGAAAVQARAPRDRARGGSRVKVRRLRQAGRRPRRRSRVHRRRAGRRPRLPRLRAQRVGHVRDRGGASPRRGGGSGEVVVVSVGDEDAEDAMRRCLAMGADRGIRVVGRGAGLDPIQVARALAEVVQSESPDLVFCGVQSSDSVQAATGGALAGLLDLPSVAVVTKIELGRGRRRSTASSRAASWTWSRSTRRQSSRSRRDQRAALRDAARDQAGGGEGDRRAPAGRPRRAGARVRRMFVPPKGEGGDAGRRRRAGSRSASRRSSRRRWRERPHRRRAPPGRGAADHPRAGLRGEGARR